MSSDVCTLSYLTQSQIVINVLMFQVLLATSVSQMLWPASDNNASLPCSNDFLKRVLANSLRKSFPKVFSNARIECMLHNAVLYKGQGCFSAPSLIFILDSSIWGENVVQSVVLLAVPNEEN